MSNLSHSESIVVDRCAEDLYDMVSDVTRIGEWSPVCKPVGGTTGAPRVRVTGPREKHDGRQNV